MRLLTQLIVATVSLAAFCSSVSQAAELKRLAYNNPGLVVDLGVGASWAEAH